jgi:hypothetical protein
MRIGSQTSIDAPSRRYGTGQPTRAKPSVVMGRPTRSPVTLPGRRSGTDVFDQIGRIMSMINGVRPISENPSRS